jgi:hypothetical protein
MMGGDRGYRAAVIAIEHLVPGVSPVTLRRRECPVSESSVTRDHYRRRVWSYAG